jgi:hypothetical protein
MRSRREARGTTGRGRLAHSSPKCFNQKVSTKGRGGVAKVGKEIKTSIKKYIKMGLDPPVPK